MTPSGPAAPVVAIEGLGTAFRSAGQEFVVHRDLNLRIMAGEMLAIVGGSGSGKTVLLRQMLGLETPRSGRITVLGRPADELAGDGAAGRVGMLFQAGALFSAFSVLDNVAFPLRELGGLPEELVRDVALVKMRMVGLEPAQAYKRPADLSGGMIKRVALARALIMDPPLLLLDEPTAGLDPDRAGELCQLLRSLHQELGLTVVMVTHDLDALFELDARVAVLADQKVVASGALDEVMRVDHPFIRSFFQGHRGRRLVNQLQEPRRER